MYIRFALGFILIICLLPIASLLDFYLRYEGFHKLTNGSMGEGGVLLGIKYGFQQIYFWEKALLLPMTYKILPGDRSTYGGPDFGWGTLYVVNFISFSVLLVSGVCWFFSQEPRRKSNMLLWATPALMFLLAYSLVIAFGRSVPRGL